MEIFNDRILPEIFNNILEHGFWLDREGHGWYILAQHHPTHEMISICIADNGMGIKNTLLTGPQKENLIIDLPLNAANDGDAIKKAFEPHVSGAFSAPDKKKGLFIKKYPRGARRGNGLVRIRDNCKALGIPLVVISQSGAVAIDKNGDMKKPFNFKNKLFAGTLYHLQVPAKNEL